MMRMPKFVVGAALAAAVVGTSLMAPFAASPANATTGPYSLQMDPVDYYAFLANPGFAPVPYQPIFGQPYGR
jgi:hypothetical protein